MRRTTSVIAVAVLAALCSSPLVAQDSELQPPALSEAAHDSIWLASGELLLGETKTLRGDVFTFDSDVLDVQRIDWRDVIELRSPRVLTYTFQRGGTATGTSAMRDSVIIVRDGGQDVRFSRADLLTIIAGPQSEWGRRILRRPIPEHRSALDGRRCGRLVPVPKGELRVGGPTWRRLSVHELRLGGSGRFR